MKADYLNHRLAMHRSLLGLAIQLALGLLLLIYSVMARDMAAMMASWFVLLGTVVWLTLAIVSDQHRRERVEAMEAESLAAADAASASVFDEGAADLRVAAKRLKFMYSVVVPAVSVLLGIVLVAIGLWQFRVGMANLPPGDVHQLRVPRGWPIGIGVALAFASFVYARYVAGMARQKVWSNLRAGGSYLAGTALVGLSIVLAHFVDLFGPDTLVRYLLVVFPGAMIGLGAEILLNFVLDIYRPRVAGETPRPAFDSRILGFVAAPDRIAESISEAINYQLGFDVTSTWFYQLLSRWVLALIAVGVLVIWLLTSLAVVEPHQRGMMVRFGRIVNPDVGPGLHFKAPWPIDRLEIPAYTRKNSEGKVELQMRTTTGVRVINAGTSPPTDDGRPILWTTEHATEDYSIVQLTRGGRAESEGRDLALVAVEIPVHYAVRDVEAYERLGPPEHRDSLLKAIAQRESMIYLSTLTLDEVLDTRRAEISRELRARIERAYGELNVLRPGEPVVELLFVGAEGVHPPRQVAPRFEQVVEATQKYLANLSRARADATRALTSVVGSVELADAISRQIDVLDGLNDELRRAGEQDRARLEASIAAQELVIQELIETAGGSAATKLLAARASRWTAHMGARARAERYQGQVRLWLASPELFQATVMFDALAEAMRRSRVYVTDHRFGQRHITIDAQDERSVQEFFEAGTQPAPDGE